MTPIAHVFPIMALGFYSSATGRTIAYGDYMLFAVPVGVICFIALMLIFRFVLRPDMSKIANLDFDALQKTVPPMGKYEKMVLGNLLSGSRNVDCSWIPEVEFSWNLPILQSTGDRIPTIGWC